MMSRSATASSCRERRFKKASNLLVADAAIAEASDRAGDERLRFAKCLAPFPRARVLRYESARAVAQIDDTFAFELAVGLRDCVGIHDQLLREGPDSRQLIPWT